MRSLIPENVPIMTLTATATKGTRKAIVNALKMIQPAVVATSPNKPNIKYSAKFKEMSLEETFAPLVEKLHQERKRMNRTVIFCRTYYQCSRIYMFIVDKLGTEMTEPVSISRDLPQFRLLDMFTACTRPTVKECILHSLPQSDGTLRVSF